MAVLTRGILGGFRGKIGNVVGSNWKGIDTMRTLPLSVANPKTAAQVGQRTKFTAVVERAKFLLTAIVKPLWDRFAQRQSGYNAFVSVNIDAYDASGVLTPADLIISQGTLTTSPSFSVTPTATQNILDVNWNNNSGTGTALATDETYLVVWNETQDVWAAYPSFDIRSTAFSSLSFPTNFVANDVIHGYLAFRRADGSLVSNTLYDTATA